ncbi:MAG: HAD-IB family hydrolase [Chitinophagaceae bacterium]|nr:HAD-IB family hydrolase [Chitinophagaceae bacterium]
MSRKIAFFDFDGTITTKDTMLEMIRYTFGSWRFMLGFMLKSPFIVAYKLKLISNHTAKQQVLKFFFGKMDKEKFNALCKEYAEEAIPVVVRAKAMKEIEMLKANGAAVIIVSASPENWLQPWCDANGLQLIATRMQVTSDRITGRIEGLNCHGEEKVCRIRQSFDLSQYDQIYCYGDTNGDKPMLDLATVSFFKPFR